MQQSGIYTTWQYFRKGKVSGQVAILITLVIAVIFLFVAVTLNISRVAQRKTKTANAADGAAMQLASGLGSWAHKLSEEAIGGEGRIGDCERDWGGLIKIVAIIVLAVINTTAAWIAAAFTAASYLYSLFTTGDAADISNKMQDMELGEHLIWKAMLYAFLHSVDNPKEGHFSNWFEGQLDKLALNDPRRPLIEDLMGIIRTFADAGNEFLLDLSEGEENLVTLLGDLRAEGYTFSFWQAGVAPENWAWTTNDRVDKLTEDLNAFYLWALGDGSGIAGLSTADQVRTVEIWMPALYNESGTMYDPGDTTGELSRPWYYIFQEHSLNLPEWTKRLEEIHSQIEKRIDQLINAEIDAIDAAWGKVNAMDPPHSAQDINTYLQNYQQGVPPPPGETDANYWYNRWADAVRIEHTLDGLDRIEELDKAIRDTDPADPERKRLLDSRRSAWDELKNKHYLDVEFSGLPDKLDPLIDLQARIAAAIEELNFFKTQLDNFVNGIPSLWVQINNVNKETAGKAYAKYKWDDSLGHHYVEVEINIKLLGEERKFRIPRLWQTEHRKWYGKKVCIHLMDYRGDVSVRVKRYDQSTDQSFFANKSTPLWKFRYPKKGITSIGKARYTWDYHNDPPFFVKYQKAD